MFVFAGDSTDLMYRRKRIGSERIRERYSIQMTKIPVKNPKIGTERRHASSLKERSDNKNIDCLLVHAHAHAVKQRDQGNQVKIRDSKRKRKKVKRKRKWKRKKNKHKFVDKSC